MTLLTRLFWEDKAQGMTEYAILLGVIAVGVAAVLVLMRTAITSKYNTVITELSKP